MEYAATCGLTIHVVPLDTSLVNNGVAHEGPVATRLGLPAIPASAETVAIAIYLALVADTGVSIHFGRISTAAGVAMIAEAKSRGLPITTDVAIHHLLLTETAIEGFNSQAHVMPPLRSETDRRALIAALKEGIIDAICADHQPHNDDAKLNPFPSTEPGISGMETLLGLSLALAETENIALNKILGALTDAPAKILGSNAGHLGIGAAADICIFDPDTLTTVDPRTFRSAGHNTPFEGWQLRGQVVQTVIAGQLMI
jgi:dihydroorotase